MYGSGGVIQDSATSDLFRQRKINEEGRAEKHRASLSVTVTRVDAILLLNCTKKIKHANARHLMRLIGKQRKRKRKQEIKEKGKEKKRGKGKGMKKGNSKAGAKSFPLRACAS